jgi:hypothetical protein
MADLKSAIAASVALLICIPAAASAATLTTIHAFGGAPGDGQS